MDNNLGNPMFPAPQVRMAFNPQGRRCNSPIRMARNKMNLIRSEIFGIGC